MGGQGRLIGGLALVLLGVLGVCLACGLPMWRETSFVGANIVTAQSVSLSPTVQRYNEEMLHKLIKFKLSRIYVTILTKEGTMLWKQMNS